MKGYGRAVEKVVRCYGGDIAQLRDVVRQAVAFDQLGDLAACLDGIRRDPGVEIVRIKNRYAVGYDPDESAGYRDVLLNLRLKDDGAAAAGHVCELQLVLKQFDQLRSADGHRRYVAFRNAMAR